MCTPIAQLPEPVPATIGANFICEFATVTTKGVPLDTPMLYSVDPDGSTIDVSTGVSYPTKAERARRNPKVGLLIEAPDDGPVVSISGRAAVRDADIQANALRYAHDFRDFLPVVASGRPWEEMRAAFWYWARIFIHCTPETIRWWQTPEATATEGAAQVWHALKPVAPPSSDPAPDGAPSAAPRWPDSDDWRVRAEAVTAMFPPPHLTVIDADGFPLPFRTTSVNPTPVGFSIDIPSGAPWSAKGSASLCFSGRATFVGRLDDSNFIVSRMLPELPLVEDPNRIFEPPAPVRKALLERLDAELARRGQGVPIMPTTPPWETSK